MFKDHNLLVFEKLDLSLHDLLKLGDFQGFTLDVIAKFGYQILSGLNILKKQKIAHCDIKLQNLL